MQNEPDATRRRNAAGRAALVCGIVAALAAVVPIVGDVVSAPFAVAALVLGFLGLHRHERGRDPGAAAAVAGTILGGLAVMLILVTLVATHTWDATTI